MIYTMYGLVSSYTLQEYLLWIIENNKIDYEEIINYNNNKLKNKYFILQLENANLIDVYDFIITKYKCVYITNKGYNYYQQINNNYILKRNNNLFLFNYYLKKEKEYTIKKVIQHLEKYNYKIKRLNETDILCKKTFGKYIINFITYYEYIKRKEIFNNRNYLVCTFSIKDKVKIEYGINTWILNHYKNFDDFQEEGFAYSVGTINNILATPDYPQIIPESTRLIYSLKKIKNDIIIDIQ